jgi:Spy/CpxP family protein refolding chaperone
MTTSIKRMALGILLIMGIALICSTAAQAQPMRMTVEERVKVLKDTLNLNDDQVSKITKFLEDQREAMTTAMSDNQGDRDAMMQARTEIMKKTDEQIKSVLSEDQAKLYDEIQKERRARMMQRMQGGNQ